MIPTIKDPIAPIPVQMVYAVPSGSVRIDIDSNTTLNTMKTIVMILGVNLVNPSDNFIEYAQITSKIPAKTKIAHAILLRSTLSRVGSSQRDSFEGGRPPKPSSVL